MKIPLIMRKQYQGQLSASMLYILLCRTGFSDRFFFLRKDYFNQKNKNTAISCDVNFKMVNHSRIIANMQVFIYATHFEVVLRYKKRKFTKTS